MASQEFAQGLLRGEHPKVNYVRATWPELILSSLAFIPSLGLLLLATIVRHLILGGESLFTIFGLVRESNAPGLVQRRASRTATMVAAARYIGSRQGWTNDVLSRHFLPTEFAKFIEFTKFFSVAPPERSGFLMARTLAGDRLIQNLKPKQIVLLGAGLDTRAHRLNLPEHCRVYEVDISTTQKFKKDIATAHPSEFSRPVIYVSVDFSKESFMTKLLQAEGFDPTVPETVVLFEGVSMYLPWEALKETMETLSKSLAPGTVVGMDVLDDYFSQDARKAAGRRPFRPLGLLLEHMVRRVGEPFQWGIPPGKTINDVFSPLGFEIVADVKSTDAERFFLTPPEGGRPYGVVPQFAHYAVLRVRSRD